MLQDGATLMHAAAQSGCAEVVAALVAAGAHKDVAVMASNCAGKPFAAVHGLRGSMHADAR